MYAAIAPHIEFEDSGDAGYVDEDEEEVPMAERELAEDAEWKLIQKNTFTRWANEHLKEKNTSIGDLQYDLTDGLRLIALVESLSGQNFRHVNRRPSFRTQKLENITLTLRFLEESEGLRLVNIDSTDIADNRLKLILGLIWTLILHYSITLPLWEGEDDHSAGGPTPKQRLLSWLNSKLVERPVKNFTTDWNDGIAIGALVDACAPGMCPDWRDWEPKQKLRNAREAMTAAEQWLDVPQLIRPEEMINPRVDEKAMMTYLSQFPNAKLKDGAPLRPRANPGNVRAHGPGLEPRGNTVGMPARFTIDAFGAGRGTVDVIVLNPKGQRESCEIISNNDKNHTYSCAYVPSQPGEYRVIIKFATKEVMNSPFKVMVEGAADPSKASAAGPGIEPQGNQVGRRTFFNIFTAGAGDGVADCVILDPQGRQDTITPVVTQQSEDNYLVQYTPKEEGLHSVNVFFAGQQIPNSPFGVMVGPRVQEPILSPQASQRSEAAPQSWKGASDPKQAYATGRGIQPQGVRVRDLTDFKVHTEDAGQGVLDVAVLGPNGRDVKCQQRKVGPHLYECTYTPQQPGPHQINARYGGDHIMLSPFKVDVGPYKESKIRAFGPGLVSGVANKPAIFVVETNGETGALGFSIEGPSEARIDCTDNGDGSATVIYWPKVPGEYAVHILCNNENIPKSPFIVPIEPDNEKYNPNKVKTYGPGISPGVVVAQPTEFTVDTREAGVPAPVTVECRDHTGEPVPLKVHDNGNGTFACSYTPRKARKHTIIPAYNGVAVRGSPFKVDVAEQSFPGKVSVYGPGIESLTLGQPTHFTVDCKLAGPGNVGIAVRDEMGRDVPMDTKDMRDGTFKVSYNPNFPGSMYTVQVFFENQEVPKSPFKVPVKPSVDMNKIQVEALPASVLKESFAKFTVDAKLVDQVGKGTVKATIVDPLKQRTAVIVQNQGNGLYKCSYSPMNDGLHLIEVTYDGVAVPGSPFKVHVAPGCDATRVQAYGPGLEAGYTHELQRFTVDLDGAGQGGLGLALEGPADAQIQCTDNKDGTCMVEYMPLLAGTYDMFIKFNDTDIPGSPFRIPISERVDPSRVRCYGPGLEPKGARAQTPASFIVDASQAGNAPITVDTVNCMGQRTPAVMVPRSDQAGVYEVTYIPEQDGPCHIEVRQKQQHVPRSPFLQHVLPACEPHKVRASGPGVKPSRPEGLTAGQPTTFQVDTREAGSGDLELTVTDSSDRPLQLEVMDHGDGIYACQYCPDEAVPHYVDIKFGGREIPESQFCVKVSPTGRPDQCRIEGGNEAKIPVFQPCSIIVNPSLAGQGKVHGRIVAPTGEPVEVIVNETSTGNVNVCYTPKMKGDHMVEIMFGGQVIPTGRFNQKAVNVDELNIPVIEETTQRSQMSSMHSTTVTQYHTASKMQGYYPVDFKLPVGPTFINVEGMVRTPNGRVIRPTLLDNGDATVTAQFQPTEAGPHELEITYNGQPIEGSPFRFYVEPVGSGRVTAYGPGLSHSKVGQPAEFTLVTRDAGAGGLSITVEGPSKSEIVCHDNKNGTCSASYLPMAPGVYIIGIKFIDQHIQGSPFTANITDDPYKISQVVVGTTSEVPLRISEADIFNLTATVTSPTGIELPCTTKRMPNGHLGISFTPKEIGNHLVHVWRSGRPIPNSPFKIYVGDAELGNAMRVRVYGQGLHEGMSNQPCQFTVDTRDAGYGGLNISIEGPSKADIECHDNQDGTCLVTYRPSEPGTYIINVKYAEENVPGSPFAVNIGGHPSPRLMERITRQREVAEATHVGSQCELSLKMPGTSVRDMTAVVISPSGKTEKCAITELDHSNYSIKFIPQEMGVHTVSVRHRNSHIPGSPFQFTVGPITDGGAHKVRAVGTGLQSGVVGLNNDFNIYTREAGAGNLSIAVEGPSRAEIDFEDRKDGSCAVSFRVSESGEYLCSIRFNDEHVPGSPFSIDIRESGADDYYASDARQLSVAAVQDTSVQIGRPMAFTVNYSGVTGRLRAYVLTPSGQEEPAIVHQIDSDQHAVRFTPQENGPYLVHVLMEERPIPGSPFRVLVGQEIGDPGLVIASGEGLHRGLVDERNNFFVTTAHAGSGSLSVTIDGPSKVQLNCAERSDGYEFTYIPYTPGNYTISIKYDDHHIVHSPFRAFISGEAVLDYHTADTAQLTISARERMITGPSRSMGWSRPESIVCSGVGLSRAYIGRTNTFNVNGKDAGNDVLYVGVSGPNVPCEEVNIKHLGENQFSVHYSVRDQGRHYIMIKWGDCHVPGSPFAVDVF